MISEKDFSKILEFNEEEKGNSKCVIHKMRKFLKGAFVNIDNLNTFNKKHFS